MTAINDSSEMAKFFKMIQFLTYHKKSSQRLEEIDEEF